MFIERMSSWTKGTWFHGVKFVQDTKNKGKIAFGIMAALLLVSGTAAGGYVYHSNVNTLYHISLDGKEIGSIENPDAVRKWLGDRLAAEKKKYPDLALGFNKEISITEKQHYNGKGTRQEDVLNKLASAVQVEANAAQLVVDGQVIAYARDQKTINQTLTSLKASYNEKKATQNLTAGAGNVSPEQAKQMESDLSEVSIKENIQIREGKILPEQVLKEPQLMNRMKKGVTIVSKHETVETLAIPYRVNVKPDPTKYRGDDKTIVQGKNGSKQVVYELVKENGKLVQKNAVHQKILQQPVTKVMIRGTKVKPSRGDGQFRMPSAGILSSPFGKRWGRIHAGIDLATPIGTPVHTSDHGRVTFVGIKRGYGKCMIVDHGNGYQSLYGHLDGFVAKKGDIVAKGEVIAKSGNTGRSTGPHLHFEIHKDGEPINPMLFLR